MNNTTTINESWNTWLNKFEIPLTMLKTEEVFETIQNPKYEKYIQGVYLPLHGEDGYSGREFYPSKKSKTWNPPGYRKTKVEWINLIKKIAKYKPVVLTCPYLRNIEILKEYIDYGIKEIKVDEYWPELDKVKNYIKISRSIVGNHTPADTIDKRFQAAVIPYRKAMDKTWLETTSKKFELNAIINHFCLINCPGQKYKDAFQDRLKRGETADYVEPFSAACHNYNNTTSSMLPREIVIRISKYFSKFKLTDRAMEPGFYINYLNYYIYNEPFSFDSLESPGAKKYAQRIYKMLMDKEKHLHGSNMETLNCLYQCASCTKKCFGITDWRNK